MAYDRTDPSDQVPEADLLDQQTPLDPSPLTDTQALPEPPAEPVDEADRAEQYEMLPGADDDYPHDLLEAGGL